MATKARMSKTDRRRQLLDVAALIARHDGTDALTLAAVAERAGVTRPVVYEHFGTRAGLLTALYNQIADHQYEHAKTALQIRDDDDLESLAGRVSAAFMHCYVTTGPEAYAIAATLKGDPLMEAAQKTLTDRYVDAYQQPFAQFTHLDPDTLRLRLVATVGAGDALAELMLTGAIDEPTATDTLTSLIVAWLPTT